MGKGNFTDEFKLDAIKQIIERGYSVAVFSRRLGVSTHSLYSWMKCYNAPEKAAAQDDQLSEIRRLKQELARATEERDMLKKPPRTSLGKQNEDIRRKILIKDAWHDRGKVYGYRKLHDDLRDQRETCCQNRAPDIIAHETK
ncbi:transposase [Pseudochrobactrum kiredjianiae]|uniref:Transposase n=1 Tax=Pseudochrobactrum kiredjianiae TaxID=386305 RepID=A0ABW3V160_9HYPH|nr:transposase [Pseudochrobactrum kiredjianiae]MDM7852782.1 transposase [Pseudochrobactrum kiredjianiae]